MRLKLPILLCLHIVYAGPVMANSSLDKEALDNSAKINSIKDTKSNIANLRIKVRDLSSTLYGEFIAMNLPDILNKTVLPSSDTVIFNGWSQPIKNVRLSEAHDADILFSAIDNSNAEEILMEIGLGFFYPQHINIYMNDHKLGSINSVRGEKILSLKIPVNYMKHEGFNVLHFELPGAKRAAGDKQNRLLAITFKRMIIRSIGQGE